MINKYKYKYIEKYNINISFLIINLFNLNSYK